MLVINVVFNKKSEQSLGIFVFFCAVNLDKFPLKMFFLVLKGTDISASPDVTSYSYSHLFIKFSF